MVSRLVTQDEFFQGCSSGNYRPVFVAPLRFSPRYFVEATTKEPEVLIHSAITYNRVDELEKVYKIEKPVEAKHE